MVTEAFPGIVRTFCRRRPEAFVPEHHRFLVFTSCGYRSTAFSPLCSVGIRRSRLCGRTLDLSFGPVIHICTSKILSSVQNHERYKLQCSHARYSRSPIEGS